MIRTWTSTSIGAAVIAILLGGSGNAQTKPAGDSAKLQRLLSRFPQADANADGILTEQEAEEYRKKRQKSTNREVESATAVTHTDVRYGSHERNSLDFWRANSQHATPVLIFFHGGSFKAGDKAIVTARPILEECLQSGISVVSANYRFSTDAPYPAQMQDGARAVQFVRSKAKEWNIEAARIAVSGSSAGATLALWVALHDDLADPASDDPIARFSTRVNCASPHSGTAGLQSRYFKEQAGVSKQGAALWQLFGVRSQVDFDSLEMQTLARDASPLTHATRDDPPLFLTYQGDPKEAPFAADAAQSNWIHHVCLGAPLKAKYDELSVECELYYTTKPAVEGAEIAFLKRHLLEKPAVHGSSR
jgi:acetyl esterase/lipase